MRRLAVCVLVALALTHALAGCGSDGAALAGPEVRPTTDTAAPVAARDVPVPATAGAAGAVAEAPAPVGAGSGPAMADAGAGSGAADVDEAPDAPVDAELGGWTDRYRLALHEQWDGGSGGSRRWAVEVDDGAGLSHVIRTETGSDGRSSTEETVATPSTSWVRVDGGSWVEHQGFVAVDEIPPVRTMEGWQLATAWFESVGLAVPAVDGDGVRRATVPAGLASAARRLPFVALTGVAVDAALELETVEDGEGRVVSVALRGSAMPPAASGAATRVAVEVVLVVVDRAASGALSIPG